MASFGELFGFSKPTAQGDASKVTKGYSSITQSPLYQPAFKGQGGVFDAIQRKNTGYDPRVLSDADSAWAKLARNQFRDQSAGITARASASGMGRSSLVPSQQFQASGDLSDKLSARSAEARLANEQNISQQQMQGRGLGVQGTQMDANTRARFAAAEKQEFDRQQAYRERADAIQRKGMMNSLTLGATALGGLGGGALGAAGALGEGVGGLQGALGGAQIGGGLFSGNPVAGLTAAGDTFGLTGGEDGIFQGANINFEKSAADAAGVDVGELATVNSLEDGDKLPRGTHFTFQGKEWISEGK